MRVCSLSVSETRREIDFPYLLAMLHGSFMSRQNTIVCPGGKMDLAMQLIFTPMILQLMDRKKRMLPQPIQGGTREPVLS